MKRIYLTIFHNSTDSTNNEAHAHILTGTCPSVIVAESQSEGRGQKGSSWHSAPGQNLTLSIALRFGKDNVPALPASGQFLISQAAALAVRDTLGHYGIAAKIKWPNDIYCGDRKICGILIENSVRGGGLSSSIIGIGLNVNETGFPEHLPNPTSMAAESGKEYDRKAVLDALTEHFDARLAQCSAERETLKRDYLQNLYRLGERHGYTDITRGEKFTGIIRSVADNACIEIECSDGNIRRFAFKEIAYIINS